MAIGEGGDVKALMEVDVVVGDRHVDKEQAGVEEGKAVVRRLCGLAHLFTRGGWDSKEVI